VNKTVYVITRNEPDIYIVQFTVYGTMYLNVSLLAKTIYCMHFETQWFF